MVDPGARNIVAEHANRNAGDETAEHSAEGETTSVISADELQAYFARLAQEVGVEPAAEDTAENTAEPAGAEVVETGETTSVISADELQAYFARLAQEVGVEPAAEDTAENTAEPAGAEVVETETAVVEEQPSADQSEGKENE